LSSPMFMRIPANRAFAYENEGLFGPGVVGSFPASRFDIVQAGNCYACGNFTASVYHSVRALEAPLDWLAAKYEAEPPKGKTQAKVIEAIEEALERARQNAGTAKNKDDIEFFSRAMLSFKNVKDAYRNSISHDRPVFDEMGANRMMTAAAHFMVELAGRVPAQQAEDEEGNRPTSSGAGGL
jgi:hypothetical protein